MDTTEDVYSAPERGEDPLNSSTISTEAPPQTNTAKGSTPKKKASTDAEPGEGSPSKKRKEEDQETKEKMKDLEKQLQELASLKKQSTAQKCRFTKLTKQLNAMKAR